MARSDEVAKPVSTPAADSDRGLSPATSDPDPNQSLPGSEQLPTDTEPAPAPAQPTTDQPSSSPPADDGAVAGGDTGADAPAEGGGSGASDSTADDLAGLPPDSDAKHGSAAGNPVSGVGDGTAGAPPPPAASNAAALDPLSAGAPILAPPAPGGVDFVWAFPGSDSGGLSPLLLHSVGCGFCYRGARFAAWLASTASRSQLPHRSMATGGAKASALSRIALASAPDPLTAQLFSLLGGGGGSAALLLFAFLAVVAGIALAVPDWTRAFRISTATWRPSLYVRPLELPG